MEIEFTAFCQDASGTGTIWIETIEAVDVDTAIEAAREACADAWDVSPSTIHVLGLAQGDITIIYWDDN